MSFKVAIIGRPNVGKSTLFNKLTGTRDALTHDKPGLTRDRKEGKASIGDLNFTVIDTAGLEKAETGTLEELMMQQTRMAIDEADIVLMTIDGREGVTALDKHFAMIIRKMNKPTLMVVNKSENDKKAPGIMESYKLGFGAPIPVSAEHNLGFSGLYEGISELAEKHDLIREDDEVIEDERFDLQICILGRPNVGKSTLFNAIIGEERSIASTFAGTTRDSIYYDVNYGDHIIKLVDTAGIRKRMKREDFLEELSVADSMKALQYANVAVMVLDATLGIDKMDLQVAGNVLEEGRAMVIAVNKWDALDDRERNTFKELLREKLEFSLSQAKYCPVIYASALKGEAVDKILNACLKAYEAWNMRISTGKLNRWLKVAVEENIPPLSNGKRITMKYITQIKSRPPTFCIFTSSNLKNLPESYMRYLKNSADKEFNFFGVPIRIIMRKSDNPFEGRRENKEDKYK
jgi:GTP-binding protein